MKTKVIAVFLCLLLTLPLLVGCGKSESEQPESVSVEDVPDEVKQKLQAALDVEPITIPAEEWTIDTICQATYINGKNLSVPCTLRDLGEGFEILEDNTNKVTFNESNHRAGGLLTYYGTYIGGFTVDDCNSEDEIFDAPLSYLRISFDKINDNVVSPVSCNGFGSGKTINMMKDRLYFMDVNTENEEEGYLFLEKTIGNFSISCIYAHGKTTDFSIHFNTEN